MLPPTIRVPSIKAHPLRGHTPGKRREPRWHRGFNSGMRYALGALEQSLWLLDTTLEVTPYTLTELVRAMELIPVSGRQGHAL